MTDRLMLRGSDVQARRPSTHVSLSRVGVTGVEKVIRIGGNGTEQLFYAELECFVDLGPEQKGAHSIRGLTPMASEIRPGPPGPGRRARRPARRTARPRMVRRGRRVLLETS